MVTRGKGHKKRGSFKNKLSKRRPKKAAKLKYEEPEDLTRAPHSFVIHRGSIGRSLSQLERDVKKVMEPFTASDLQVSKKNSVQDFINISSTLKVSHLLIFTNTTIGAYLKIVRLPHGPTLSFRINNYCLAKDVISALKRQYNHKKLFTNSPLIILKDFNGDANQISLMATSFQSMFPTINVTKVNLSDVKRCVMMKYNQDDKTIDFRHYAIKVTPTGVSKVTKKILQGRVPNLKSCNDIAETLIKNEVSDSEAEDDPKSHVELPQKLSSRGSIKNSQSRIELKEIGPRLNLQLIKVEEGVMDGEVMFHEIVQKTEKEKKIIKKRLSEKKRLKEQRRLHQEANVKKKEELKEAHKKKSLAGMTRQTVEDKNDITDEDNDEEYFRNEVGQDPDEEIFSKSSSENPKDSKRYGFKRKREATDKCDESTLPKFKKRNDSGRDNDNHKKFAKRDGNNRGRDRKVDKHCARDRKKENFKKHEGNSKSKNRGSKKTMKKNRR